MTRHHPLPKLTHLSAELYNTPLMIEPTRLQALVEMVGPRLEGLAPIAANNEPGSQPVNTVTTGKIALITIHGPLANRRGGMEALCGMTSYETLTRQLRAAIGDESVTGILLDINSPGGSAAGCFQLAKQIRQWQASKPIYASVDAMACSAAYALASACTRIYAVPLSTLANIGAVMMHTDISGEDAQDGIKRTIIQAGKYKWEGNPYEPLSGLCPQRNAERRG